MPSVRFRTNTWPRAARFSTSMTVTIALVFVADRRGACAGRASMSGYGTGGQDPLIVVVCVEDLDHVHRHRVHAENLPYRLTSMPRGAARS